MRMLVAVLFLAIAGSSTHAQRSTSEELVTMAVFPTTEYSKAGRARLTTLVLAYCHELLDALPTNKPNEQAWVLNEMKTSDQVKIERLISSVEYSRYYLKDNLDTCVERTERLQKEQQQRGTRDITRFEAANYLSIALIFNSDTDLLFHAKRAGLDIAHFKLDFLSAIRRALLIASMRALEDQ